MKSELLSWLGISPNNNQIDINAIETLFGANQKLQSIKDAPNTIGCVYELDEIVGHLAEITAHTMSATGLSVFLLDKDIQDLSGFICDSKFGGERQIRTSKGSKTASWVISRGKPLILNDVTSSPLWNGEIYRDSHISVGSIMCVPLISHRGIIGVMEVFDKVNGEGFAEHDLEILMPVANTAAIAVENCRTHKLMVEDVKNTIKALAAAIDARDPYTRDHSQGVVRYSLMCGRSLSLSRSRLEILEYAGILHDVGKIGIPDAILTKPGPLTDKEYAVIREHPIISANIINGIPLLEPAIELVLHHHERYNGSGYPDGLTREDIPMGARILAVADAFDAMTTDRPYRPRMPQNHALVELRKYSGKQFCPIAVDAFLFALESEQDSFEWRPRS
jgi:HD-GYP domain-containing protein (c-di-GMP phosphodiesterase class II)